MNVLSVVPLKDFHLKGNIRELLLCLVRTYLNKLLEALQLDGDIRELLLCLGKGKF